MSFDYKYVLSPTGQPDSHVLREMFDDVKEYINSDLVNIYATKELDNLGTTAINSSLISDTNNTDDLGSSSKAWKDVYIAGDIKVGSTTAIDFSASGAVAIRGTATNDTASVGFVGQYSSAVQTTAVNFPTSNNYGDLLSISLTAGDWDVTGIVRALVATATWTIVECGLSTVSGDDSTGLVQGDTSNRLEWASTSTARVREAIVIPVVRFSFSSTTTVYLKYRAVYSAGQPTAGGRISARRVR